MRLNSLPAWLASLSLVAFMAGCDSGKKGNFKEVPKGTVVKETAHEHHHEHGPHGGHIIELGEEEYHAELAHDEAAKTVTIYLLDKTAKVAVPIADPEIVLNLVVDGQPLQVKLAAAPQEGDPAGHSSRFSLADEKVLEALEAPKTTGRLNVTIGGKSYTGAVEHHEHGEHK